MTYDTYRKNASPYGSRSRSCRSRFASRSASSYQKQRGAEPRFRDRDQDDESKEPRRGPQFATTTKPSIIDYDWNPFPEHIWGPLLTLSLDPDGVSAEENVAEAESADESNNPFFSSSRLSASTSSAPSLFQQFNQFQPKTLGFPTPLSIPLFLDDSNEEAEEVAETESESEDSDSSTSPSIEEIPDYRADAYASDSSDSVSEVSPYDQYERESPEYDYYSSARSSYSSASSSRYRPRSRSPDYPSNFSSYSSQFDPVRRPALRASRERSRSPSPALVSKYDNSPPSLFQSTPYTPYQSKTVVQIPSKPIPPQVPQAAPLRPAPPPQIQIQRQLQPQQQPYFVGASFQSTPYQVLVPVTQRQPYQQPFTYPYQSQPPPQPMMQPVVQPPSDPRTKRKRKVDSISVAPPEPKAIASTAPPPFLPSLAPAKPKKKSIRFAEVLVQVPPAVLFVPRPREKQVEKAAAVAPPAEAKQKEPAVADIADWLANIDLDDFMRMEVSDQYY